MPPISIGGVEAVWLLACLIGAGYTVFAVKDTWADRRAYKRLGNGSHVRSSRGIAIAGNFRREVLRLTIQLIALGLAIPGIFSDRPTPFNIYVAGLMAIPLILMVQSILDRKTRNDLASLTTAELLAERARTDERVDKALKALGVDIHTEVLRNDEFARRLNAHEQRSDAQDHRADAQDTRADKQDTRLDAQRDSQTHG